MNDATNYSERESTPEEADRGRMLDALAAGAFWVYVTAVVEPDGISLKLESSDGLDADEIKVLLRKTVAALP